MSVNNRATLYERICSARKILELPEEATIDEIRRTFREKIRQWHPDKVQNCTPEHREKTHRIIEANDVIMDYCKRFKISFEKETVDRYRTEEEIWWDRFGQDPMWGYGR